MQQHGIGEMQLLAGALAPLSRKRRIALIQPPHAPQALACDDLGIDAANLLWIKAARSADALWSAEQLLGSGDGCGAVILWQANIRPESLRRLNLAAQAADIWLWVMRPISARADASPSPLRLALRPSFGGITIDIVKRRGPALDQPLRLALPNMPSTTYVELDHALLDQRVSAVAAARSLAPALV